MLRFIITFAIAASLATLSAGSETLLEGGRFCPPKIDTFNEVGRMRVSAIQKPFAAIKNSVSVIPDYDPHLTVSWSSGDERRWIWAADSLNGSSPVRDAGGWLIPLGVTVGAGALIYTIFSVRGR